MTNRTPTDAPTLDTLTDPAAFRDRDDVPFTEETRVTDEAHFQEHDPYAGVVAVGVTDDDGRVLLMDHDRGHGWALPHGPVDHDADFVAAGRRWVDRHAGVDVAVHGVERVSEETYVLETDEDRRTTAFYVVLRASLPADTDPTDVESDDDAVDVGWFGDAPEGVAGGSAEADVRRFLG